MKAAAEGKGKGGRAPHRTFPVEMKAFERQAAPRLEPTDAEAPASAAAAAAEPSAAPAAAVPPQAKPTQPEQPVKRRRGNPFETSQKPSVLKARKKEYLKKKKKRGRGQVADPGAAGQESESDPEDRMSARMEATRPAFAEQADQPISINLKRRHWTETQTQDHAASRCTKIFARQMEQAKRQAGMSPADDAQALEAARTGLAEAYRKQKRGDDGSKATMASLAALVHKGHGAT